jgi:transcriptional regulator
MYLPSHFAETGTEVLHDFMRRHSLATIVVNDDSGLTADHVPLVLRTAGNSTELVGHVARANPLWRKAGAGTDCLVVFQGVQGYISPNGYASKSETGRVVPTWNYEAVHVRGRISAVDDALWLRGLLDELTAKHEAGQSRPWQPGDAPADYINQLLQAIVGIRIEISAMVGKFKLSQNQPATNQQSLVRALQAAGDSASLDMANAVRDRMEPRP